MDIQNVNSNTSHQLQQQGELGKSEMGKNDFLQLLIAQMRHQDPINPLDSADFAAQLAQFNSVEQLINVNQGIESILESQEMMSMNFTHSMAASLAGKSVKALSDQVFLPAEGEIPIHFKLNRSAENVDLIIRASDGSEVRRVSMENLQAGDNSWIWDGRDQNGNRLGEGGYTVEIVDPEGDTGLGSLVYTEGVVEKVRFEDGGVFLIVNDLKIPISDVEEVG